MHKFEALLLYLEATDLEYDSKEGLRSLIMDCQKEFEIENRQKNSALAIKVAYEVTLGLIIDKILSRVGEA